MLSFLKDSIFVFFRFFSSKTFLETSLESSSNKASLTLRPAKINEIAFKDWAIFYCRECVQCQNWN